MHTNKLFNLLFVLLLIYFSYSIYVSSYSDTPRFLNNISLSHQPLLNINKSNTYSVTTAHKNQIKLIKAQFVVPPDKLATANHSSTITTLTPINQLLVLWFAGSIEGNPDVKIWQSYYYESTGKWSMPTIAVSPQSLTQAMQRYVRVVGNSVVYYSPTSNMLHLFVVSRTIGGWSISRLNHLVSHDFGQHWQFIEQLPLSPFFNISNLDRTSAIPLADGGFYLPIYHELAYVYPELLRFDHNGTLINNRKIAAKNGLLQPTLAIFDESTAYAFFRNNTKYSGDSFIYYSISHDAGIHWLLPKPTSLHNFNSSIAVTYIPLLHKFIMVHNIGKYRNILSIATSLDGINWDEILTLENDTNIQHEYSYPGLTINYATHTINISYSWQRRTIKVITLTYDF